MKKKILEGINKPLNWWKGHEDRIYSMVTVQVNDKTTVWTGSADGKIICWDYSVCYFPFSIPSRRPTNHANTRQAH